MQASRTQQSPVIPGLKGLFSLGIACLALASCATSTPQPSIADACEALVLDYAYYRDREDPKIAAQGVAEVFTEDASLTVNGESFEGRAAIYDRIAEQTNPPLTAHMMSTIRIFPTSTNSATGVSYATIYLTPRPKAGSAVAQSFTAVGEYQDEFRLTADGWRIAKREFVIRILPEADPT